MVSRTRASGRSNGRLCQSAFSRFTPVPRPSTIRPSLASSRSSADSAVTIGLRVKAQAIALPIRARRVSRAMAISGRNAVRCSSLAQTLSNPASSAARATATISSMVSPQGPSEGRGAVDRLTPAPPPA
jgi:hypothetical protein